MFECQRIPGLWPFEFDFRNVLKRSLHDIISSWLNFWTRGEFKKVSRLSQAQFAEITINFAEVFRCRWRLMDDAAFRNARFG
jgi:hypothetical protein